MYEDVNQRKVTFKVFQKSNQLKLYYIRQKGNNNNSRDAESRRSVYSFRYRSSIDYWIRSHLLFIVGYGLALCSLVSARQYNPHYHQVCPGCLQQQHNFFQNANEGLDPAPDDLRLEVIKRQILTKLGLKKPPDVDPSTVPIPRHLVLETLHRADSHRRPLNQDLHYKNNNKTFYYGSNEYSYRYVEDYVTGNVGDNSELSTSYTSSDDDAARQELQEEIDEFYAKTSEIITFAEPGRTLNEQPLLEFPLSSSIPILEPLRIHKVNLWTRVEFWHKHYQHHHEPPHAQKNITLWVFRVLCGNMTHLRGRELGHHLEMVTSLGVNISQLGWQKFDVTEIITNWYKSRGSMEKLTLLVDCTGCGTSVHVSTFSKSTYYANDSTKIPDGERDPDRPFLIVQTDPTTAKRIRRRAIDCSGAIKGQCCKQRFYVSFTQLGWDDWIIAPQGYYANYCRGDCAAGNRTPDTFLNYYTHVIEEYRKMDRLVGMQPCCAPLKFSPMSLIYYGPDSNIIKRDLPKMVVDECGCP